MSELLHYAASAPSLKSYFVEPLDHDGTVLATQRPLNLKFTLNKKPPHTIQYELPLLSASDDAGPTTHDQIGPYRTDFRLKQGASVLMEGMHTAVNMEGEGDTIKVYGKDWFHYLERRHFPFNPKPNDVNDFVIGTASTGLAYEVYARDVALIVKDLLDVTLSRPDSLAIDTSSMGAIGITTNHQVVLGDDTTMASIIDGFSEIDPGFVYEVYPDKTLVFTFGSKYDPAVWDDPSYASYVFPDTSNQVEIKSIEFTNNGPAATHWLGLGAGIGQEKLGAARGLPANQAIYRRLDESADYGEQANRSKIIARTMQDLKYAANPQHDLTMTIIPGPNATSNFIDFSLLWPGNAIWVDQELTAHQIDSAQEIVQMDCSVSNEGEIEVVLALQQIYESTTAGVLQA